MSELDSQERDFLNQATQLNALDNLMIENGDKVIYLNWLIFFRFNFNSSLILNIVDVSN